MPVKQSPVKLITTYGSAVIVVITIVSMLYKAASEAVIAKENISQVQISVTNLNNKVESVSTDVADIKTKLAVLIDRSKNHDVNVSADATVASSK